VALCRERKAAATGEDTLMGELVEVLRRAVRAEIAAAIDAAGPIRDTRRMTSLAELREVERCSVYAAGDSRTVRATTR
jgi:hypothetical protein